MVLMHCLNIFLHELFYSIQVTIVILCTALIQYKIFNIETEYLMESHKTKAIEISSAMN